MADRGCYVDGGIRNVHEGNLAAIAVAESFGFVPDWCDVSETDADYEDQVEHVLSTAEEWLNEHVAKDGEWWGWDQGDWGLWSSNDEVCAQ
jgi:hypothetical protein